MIWWCIYIDTTHEVRRLSQVVVDDIIQEWDGLFSHTVHRLNARVQAELSKSGIDVQSVFEDVPSPFEGLETLFLQEKYYQETLGLVVSGEACVWCN